MEIPMNVNGELMRYYLCRWPIWFMYLEWKLFLLQK